MTTIEREPVHDGVASEPRTAAGIALSLVALGLFLAALAIRSQLVFGLVALAAVFIPAERLLPVTRQRVLRRHWASDLVHFVVDNLLTLVGVVAAVVAVGFAVRAAVPGGVRDAIAAQPALLQFVEALLLAGVAGYWAHRATHQVAWLWKFHRVHHSIREMDWLAAGRLHPIDQAFTRSCIVVPLFALGFSRATFGAFLVVATLQAIFIHANVRVTFGPLRHVIATPEFHHWHHGADPDVRDRNFAGELPVLDRIFGTLHLADPHEPALRWPAAYGVDEEPPTGYLRQLAWPFRRATPAA